MRTIVIGVECTSNSKIVGLLLRAVKMETIKKSLKAGRHLFVRGERRR